MTKERWRITLEVVLDRDVSGDDPPGDWQWEEILQLIPGEEVHLWSATLEAIERGH